MFRLVLLLVAIMTTTCNKPHVLMSETPSGPAPCDYCVWGRQLDAVSLYCDGTSWAWGDWNLDHVIDDRDVAMLASCSQGPEVPAELVLVTLSSRAYDDNTLEAGSWAWNCRAMDGDGDGDVDSVEFGMMQRVLGPVPDTRRADGGAYVNDCLWGI